VAGANYQENVNEEKKNHPMKNMETSTLSHWWVQHQAYERAVRSAFSPREKWEEILPQ